MPQLILLLILVIVVVPLAVAKLVLDYRSKQEIREEGVRLTVAELEELVRRYVEDATAPLHERIRALERALESDRSDDGHESFPSDQSLIDDPTLDDDSLRVDDGDSGSSSGVT